MFRVRLLMSIVGLAPCLLSAQTQIDLRTQAKSVDFQAASSTKPLRTSATLPATCTPNEMLLLTTAPAGSNIYACISNAWVVENGSSSQGFAIQNGGTTVATRSAANFIPGLGIANVVTDLGDKVNVQQGVDTSIILSRAGHQAGQALLCQSASGSGTAYTCGLNPTLTGYTSGMVLHWKPDIAAIGGGATLNIDLLGPVRITETDGSSNPAPSEILAGRLYSIWYDGTVFRLMGNASAAGSGSSGAANPIGGPNQVLATDPSGSMTDAATLRALVPADIPAAVRRRGFHLIFSGADLTAGSVVYVTMPSACTASGYTITADPAGSATIQLWKVADGTALPTSANSISTNGFSLLTGNKIHSTNLSDLTTTSWAAYDTTGVYLASVAGSPKHVNFVLECVQ